MYDIYLLQQLVCNLRKQAVHVITILGGSLEQDNNIYTTEQCGDNAGGHLEEIHPVSGGELLPHVAGDLVVVAVNLVTHQHPQHLHTPELSIMDKLTNQSALHYKAAPNESSPWGWRTPRSPAASLGSSRRWAGW